MSVGPVERLERIRKLIRAVTVNTNTIRGSDITTVRKLAATCRDKNVAEIAAELGEMDKAGTLAEIAEFLDVTYGGGK